MIAWNILDNRILWFFVLRAVFGQCSITAVGVENIFKIYKRILLTLKYLFYTKSAYSICFVPMFVLLNKFPKWMNAVTLVKTPQNHKWIQGCKIFNYWFYLIGMTKYVSIVRSIKIRSRTRNITYFGNLHCPAKNYYYTTR